MNKDAMPTLMDLLQEEEHTGVRAILGHNIFVHIHLYIDGNGRMGRLKQELPPGLQKNLMMQVIM